MVDQSAARDFDQRLTDFSPELRRFLKRVWERRNAISLSSFSGGTWQIYSMYAQMNEGAQYRYGTLRDFIHRLLRVADNVNGFLLPQGRYPRNILSGSFWTYGTGLWTDFFHLLSGDRLRPIRSRTYIHASGVNQSLDLMALIAQQFRRNEGLWEVKVAGPGVSRLDTIVAYHYDKASSDELVDHLRRRAQPGLFAAGLPPLVRTKFTGVGVADEPPGIEIYRDQGDRHSFGSFYSDLCWISLKTTPNVRNPQGDGRHFLDQMLYCLRCLGVHPQQTHRFPEAAALESLVRAHGGAPG